MKCNHIIGFEGLDCHEPGFFLRESDKNDDVFRYSETCNKFKFCPLCGERIADDHDF